jgi:Holliday junction resolvasome RuvABC endonuclease subunit
MNAPIVFGIDPSLTAFGVAIAEVSRESMFDEPGFTFRAVELLTTTRGNEARLMDATSRRCRAIARRLSALVAHWRPVLFCVEGHVFPSGKGAQKNTVHALGRVRGIVDTIAEIGGTPLEEAVPMVLKRKVTDDPGAEKSKVREVLASLYPELEQMLAGYSDQNAENMTDAAAAIFTLCTGEAIESALRLAAAGELNERSRRRWATDVKHRHELQRRA